MINAKSLRLSLVVLACASVALVHANPLQRGGNGRSARNISLKAGDQAPPLKIRQWMQGVPITRLEKGQIYVFEFWATWCGPCFQAMPHLSELSKKYAGKVTFTGVDVWESQDFPGSDPVQLVSKFLSKNPGRMSYNVCVDDGDSMGNNWLRAAGQEGIPCSFIIGEDGKIDWIGHPYYIEPVLEKVVSGTFDLATYTAEEKAKKAAEAAADAPNLAIIKPVDDALRAKDYARVLGLVAVIEKDHPELALRVFMAKDQALIASKDEKPIQEAFQKSLDAPKPITMMTSVLALQTVNADGLQKQTYILAAKYWDDVVNRTPGANARNCLYLSAQAFLKGQDYDQAIADAQKAIDSGIKDQILDSQMKMFTDFLAKCKAAKAAAR